LHFGLEVPDAPEQYRATATPGTPLVKMLRDPRSGDLLDFVVDVGVVPDELIDIIRLGARDIGQALAADAPNKPVPAEILYRLITTAHMKSACIGPIAFSDQFQADLSRLFGKPYDRAKEPYLSIVDQLGTSGTANTLTVSGLLGLENHWKSKLGSLGPEQWGWLLQLAMRGMRVITLSRTKDQTPHAQFNQLFDKACASVDLKAYGAQAKDEALKTLWWCADKHIAETITLDTTFWHDRENNAEWVDPQPKKFGDKEYWDIRNGQILNFKHLFDTIADRLAPALGGRAITVGDFALQMLDAAPLFRFVRLPSKEGAA
jgi:hypothetical protein